MNQSSSIQHLKAHITDYDVNKTEASADESRRMKAKGGDPSAQASVLLTS
jgi:hypothetical protein